MPCILPVIVLKQGLQQEPQDLIAQAALVSRQWFSIATSQQIWAQKLAPPLRVLDVPFPYGACSQPSRYMWPRLWSYLYLRNLLHDEDWTYRFDDETRSIKGGDCCWRGKTRGCCQDLVCDKGAWCISAALLLASIAHV